MHKFRSSNPGLSHGRVRLERCWMSGLTSRLDENASDISEYMAWPRKNLRSKRLSSGQAIVAVVGNDLSP